MSEPKQILGNIVTASALTRQSQWKHPEKHINYEVWNYLFNKESVSQFLWECYRELPKRNGGTMQWGNMIVERRDDTLIVNIKRFRSPRKVTARFTINLNPLTRADR